MTSHSHHSQDHSAQAPKPGLPDKDLVDQKPQNDALWDILGKASNQQPSTFFARNVVRESRLQKKQAHYPGSRFLALITPTRFALSAAACASIMLAYQLWPSYEPVGIAPITAQHGTPEPSTTLTELVILESLQAAAEDPTIFTHDEVVAMIGF